MQKAHELNSSLDFPLFTPTGEPGVESTTSGVEDHTGLDVGRPLKAHLGRGATTGVVNASAFPLRSTTAHGMALEWGGTFVTGR